MRELLWLQAIRDFYGLGPEVNLENHLVTRSTENMDRPKRLYYIGPGKLHCLHPEPAPSDLSNAIILHAALKWACGRQRMYEQGGLITCREWSCIGIAHCVPRGQCFAEVLVGMQASGRC